MTLMSDEGSGFGVWVRCTDDGPNRLKQCHYLALSPAPCKVHVINAHPTLQQPTLPTLSSTSSTSLHYTNLYNQNHYSLNPTSL